MSYRMWYLPIIFFAYPVSLLKRCKHPIEAKLFTCFISKTSDELQFVSVLLICERMG